MHLLIARSRGSKQKEALHWKNQLTVRHCGFGPLGYISKLKELNPLHSFISYLFIYKSNIGNSSLKTRPPHYDTVTSKLSGTSLIKKGDELPSKIHSISSKDRKSDTELFLIKPIASEDESMSKPHDALILHQLLKYRVQKYFQH